MRLLFVNSTRPDYLEDQLFSGLTSILGEEMVVPYPVNAKFYFPRRPYPRNMGRAKPPLRFLPDRVALGKQLKRFAFDAVVIGSTKQDTFERYLEIEDRIPKGLPLIYVDGGDWPEIGGDARRMNFESHFRRIAQRDFTLIFKREYVIHHEYAKNVVPFPMSWYDVAIPKTKPKYQVTCWCVESHPMRTEALKLLAGHFDCGSNGTVPGQTFRSYSRKGKRYLRELSAGAIACTFRGVGWDTLRYWEIPGVRTFMVSNEPQIVIPNNFVHGEHLVFCKDDLRDLLDLISYYLRNEREREEMAASAHTHVIKHHTHRARARFFIQRLKECGIGN